MKRDEGNAPSRKRVLRNMATGSAPRWVVIALAMTTLGAVAGWWWQLRPMAVVWGDVATWVTGLATALGVLFAAGQIRVARKTAERDRLAAIANEQKRREDLSRTVSATFRISDIGYRTELLCKVNNAGSVPISGLSLRAVVLKTDTSHYEPVSADKFIPSLMPGAKKSSTLRINDQLDGIDLLIELTFIDFWGTTRRRLSNHHGLAPDDRMGSALADDVRS